MIPSFPAWTTEGHWCPSLRWEAQVKSRSGEKMLYLISEMLGCRYHGGLEGRSEDRFLPRQKPVPYPQPGCCQPLIKGHMEVGMVQNTPLPGDGDR